MEKNSGRKLLPVGLLVAKKRNQLQHSILRFGARNPKGIPDVFTNEDKLEVILDQQQSSACAAFSFKQVLKIQHFQVKDPSASWIYSCVRDKEENYPKKKLEDNGVDPTDVLTVLTNIGIVRETDYPFSMATIDNLPPANLFSTAEKNKVGSAYAINPQDTATIQQLIAKGIPVSVGLIIYENFVDNGNIGLPQGMVQGGHETSIIGYDKKRQLWLLVNSWGPNWGRSGWVSWNKQKGLFTLPFAYTENPEWCLFAGVAIP